MKISRIKNYFSSLIKTIHRRPILFVLAFVGIGLITLLISFAYSLPTKSVNISLASCSGSIRCYDGAAASNSSIAYNGGTTTPPTGSGSLYLVNPWLKTWMNARQTVTNPTPQACVNLECSETGDNGSASPLGQFRLGCQYSHFNMDDPIVYPGQPMKAHLHMFFGNTATNAYTHYDPNDTSVNSLTHYGGSSCQGAELNRTAYWMPAMFDGTGNVVIPKSIVVYYKSHNPSAAISMPEGLKMIAGNSKGNTNQNQIGYHQLEWDCYDNSQSWVNASITIPDTCPAGHFLHAVISFPECWNGTGYNITDVSEANNGVCPAGTKQMPQVQYVVDYPISPTGNYSNWYLSSDRMPGQPQLADGSSLHGDWFGGWNKSVVDLWTSSCVRAQRNCTLGQMGPGNLHLKRMPKDNNTYEDFPGPYFVRSPM